MITLWKIWSMWTIQYTPPVWKLVYSSKGTEFNLITETQIGDDGYPTYKQRASNGCWFTAISNIHGTTVTIDNRWIVPCFKCSYHCRLLILCIGYKYINKDKPLILHEQNPNQRTSKINQIQNSRTLQLILDQNHSRNQRELLRKAQFTFKSLQMYTKPNFNPSPYLSQSQTHQSPSQSNKLPKP